MKSYKLHAITIIIIFSFLSGVVTADDAAPKDDAYHYFKPAWMTSYTMNCGASMGRIIILNS
jgi:hypothetical protein